MNQLSISPTILQWALERSGLTAESLGEKGSNIGKWLAGESRPTLGQLEKFAHRTHTPLGYFFLTEPPEEKLPIPDFRTVAGGRPQRPSPELLETVATMQERQAWMHEQLAEDGAEPLSFVASASPGMNAGTIASTMRKALGLESGWAAGLKDPAEAIRHVRLRTEKLGVLVMANGVIGNNTSRSLKVEEFRGFALCDDLAPLVFINGKDAKSAQLFTLVHELAHLWLGRDGISNPAESDTEDADEIETLCNRTAAEFLVPAEEFVARWSALRDHDDPAGALARRFKVSVPVIARRAMELGLLSRNEFFNLIADHRRKMATLPPKESDGGGSFWLNQGPRIGERFGSAVVRAAKEGRLLYRDAYRLTDLHGKTFNNYARSLGFRI